MHLGIVWSVLGAHQGVSRGGLEAHLGVSEGGLAAHLGIPGVVWAKGAGPSRPAAARTVPTSRHPARLVAFGVFGVFGLFGVFGVFALF